MIGTNVVRVGLRESLLCCIHRRYQEKGVEPQQLDALSARPYCEYIFQSSNSQESETLMRAMKRSVLRRHKLSLERGRSKLVLKQT